MFYTYDVLDDVLKMSDAFEKFFGDASVRKHYPYINVFEKDDKVIIKSAIPGMTVENVDIELVNHSLVIKGERKQEKSDSGFIRNERNFGFFNKAVKLPYDVDRTNVKAVLKDGILTIELVKSESAKPKKIEIK